MLHDYDAVFDTVGDETYRRSFKVLKKGGIIVSMLEQPKFRTNELVWYKVNILIHTSEYGERWTKLAQSIDENKDVKIHTDRTFSLDEASKALDYQRDVHPQGKVILSL